MNVLNIHERELLTSPERIGALIDSLASARDALWPTHSWPNMQFDRPLAMGAIGGHGPIEYTVEEYHPGKSISFRFIGPKGFCGTHGYEVTSEARRPAILRHTLKMTTHGASVFSWPLVFRPLHDALIEDSLTTAEASLGLEPKLQPWSLWVRFLRWVISGGRARPQVPPTKSLKKCLEKYNYPKRYT